MRRRAASKGQCAYCEEVMSKAGMTKHLAACTQRQDAIAKAEATKARAQNLYHLRAEAVHQSAFWLDLEMRGSATLGSLDSYLRAIWLECCGHLSRFSAGRQRWGEEIDMNCRADEVFSPGTELTHIYDFGTTSETLIRMVDVRHGKPTTRHPIALLARNLMPKEKCSECDEPATHLCVECLYEYGEAGTLCDKHAKVHPHDNYGAPMPIVNSPRVGMCGYTGPADPPY